MNDGQPDTDAPVITDGGDAVIDLAAITDSALETRLAEIIENSEEPCIQVVLPIQKYTTASLPVLCECSDGLRYVVKTARGDKQPVNDSVLAQIGREIGAPVCETIIVFVPPELVTDGLLKGLPAGPAHASKFIEDVTFVHSLPSNPEPENLPRIRRLALFFGLCAGSDPQYIQQNSPPKFIFTHDLGHFINENWNTSHLDGASEPVFHEGLAGIAHMSAADFAAEVTALTQLTDTKIIAAVGRPPSAWPITLRERAVLAKWIASRRDGLIAKYGVKQ